MKTIFDESTRLELIDRINSLTEKSIAQWGKMNVYQMTRHITLWNEWVLGKNNPTYKQSFFGLIFGRLGLNMSVRDDKPLKRNVPTSDDMIIKETIGNIELRKKKWIECIATYAHFSNPEFIHDFFGKMTEEEIGIFVYKHCDHHLRQFNT